MFIPLHVIHHFLDFNFSITCHVGGDGGGTFQIIFDIDKSGSRVISEIHETGFALVLSLTRHWLLSANSLHCRTGDLMVPTLTELPHC